MQVANVILPLTVNATAATIPITATTLTIGGTSFDINPGNDTIVVTDTTRNTSFVGAIQGSPTATSLSVGIPSGFVFSVGDLFTAVVDADSATSGPSPGAQIATVVPVVNPGAAPVPAMAQGSTLVISGAGFDPAGTNTVTLTDATNPTDVVTVSSTTVTSTNQILVTVVGTFSVHDVLNAVVTTDGFATLDSGRDNRVSRSHKHDG